MKPWQAHVALFGIALVWGSTFTMIKHTLREMGPATFLSLRFAVACLFLLVLFPKKILKGKRDGISAGFFLGAALGVGFWFQTYGLQYTTAGKSAFITGLYIVVVPLLAKWFFPLQPIGAQRILGVILAVLGLALMSLQPGLTFVKGDLWTAGCTLFFALQVILVSLYGKRYDIIWLTFTQLATVCLLCVGVAVLLESSPFPLSPASWGTVLFSAFFATVLAFGVQLKVQPFTSPTVAALIMSLEGVVAAFIGWAWDGEMLSAREVLGALLMLAGMLVVQFPFRRPFQPATGNVRNLS